MRTRAHRLLSLVGLLRNVSSRLGCACRMPVVTDFTLRATRLP
jgi:hypothetical protein